MHAAVASGRKPLSSSIGSNSPTLSDMAAQSNVMVPLYEAPNQQGGDMLTGATVVHRNRSPSWSAGVRWHVELEPILSHFRGSVSDRSRDLRQASGLTAVSCLSWKTQLGTAPIVSISFDEDENMCKHASLVVVLPKVP